MLPHSNPPILSHQDIGALLGDCMHQFRSPLVQALNLIRTSQQLQPQRQEWAAGATLHSALTHLIPVLEQGLLFVELAGCLAEPLTIPQQLIWADVDLAQIVARVGGFLQIVQHERRLPVSITIDDTATPHIIRSTYAVVEGCVLRIALWLLMHPVLPAHHRTYLHLYLKLHPTPHLILMKNGLASCDDEAVFSSIRSVLHELAATLSITQHDDTGEITLTFPTQEHPTRS